MNANEFAAKMESEGGLIELAGYGLDPKKIKDKALKEMWSQFCDIFNELEGLESKIEDYLADVVDEIEEDG